MEKDRDASSADEYFMTAVQIFDYCGGESSGTIRVDTLMEKFAPFVKTDKEDFVNLKLLLDPEESNPEINVTRLARALGQYSHMSRSKVDLDESFNLKCSPMPQDSDSGISTDGFQLLEELQCELREKAHLSAQLREQLEYSDRQHEEAANALTAQRDHLRAQLNQLREENTTLLHVKSDYEEACDRLCASETALDSARHDLDGLRKRAKAMDEQIQELETERVSLQEQLLKSKAECHRMNEMYASRQSVLLEENETLRAEHADLSAKLQDHDEFVQQLVKEKVLLEMELKDVLNKANHTQHRFDRSIDVSYTDDQMLSALDTLTVDSRVVPEQQLLDEEAFVNALKEDQGRMTNLSLFDEIRLSISNTSRQQFNYDCPMSDVSGRFDDSLPIDTIAVGTQTEEEDPSGKLQCSNCSKNIIKSNEKAIPVAIQTDNKTDRSHVHDLVRNYDLAHRSQGLKSIAVQTKIQPERVPANTQTDSVNEELKSNIETENLNIDLGNRSQGLQSFAIQTKVQSEKNAHTQNKREDEEPQTNGENINNDLAIRSQSLKSIAIQTKILPEKISANTQTDSIDFKPQPNTESETNNNCKDCTKCTECENRNHYTKKLENDLRKSQNTLKELQESLDSYENNLDLLQKYLDDGNERNSLLQMVVDSLQTKLSILEAACSQQNDKIDSMALICDVEHCGVQCQTDCDQSSVGTQAEVPCKDCVKRDVTPHRGITRYLWDPLKTLFQLCAAACFLCALSVLYSLTSRWRARCRHVPWRWLDAHELLDMLLRVDYVADVPM